MQNNKLKVGFIGFRGLVGSVLLKRMSEENDFDKIIPYFFSSSLKNTLHDFSYLKGLGSITILDPHKLTQLINLDCIINTNGSTYAREVLPLLRKEGFSGYWLDASSALRYKPDSIIVLDPVNREVIDNALKKGIKNFCGGNCTVSLLLLALHGLIKANLIEWVTTMTYQAVSGAGAKAMLELLSQNKILDAAIKPLLDSNQSILEIEEVARHALESLSFDSSALNSPIATNLIPWIDKESINIGQTQEEFKASIEANKILNYPIKPIAIDGLCVRVGTLRCHAQALTIKLNNVDLSIGEITQLIQDGNQWVKVIPNNQPSTLSELTPLHASNSLNILVGRIRKLSIGNDYLTLFTIGDQLLWGAAEPIRRMLNILISNSEN